MSKTIKQRYNCPNCGYSQKILVWDNISAAEEPDVKRAVLDGSLFDFKCIKCAYQASLNYALLYYDVITRLVLCHIPESGGGNEENALSEIMSMSGAKSNFTDMGFSMRIVRDLASMREKVRIFDRGRDDRIIELLKILAEAKLLNEHPGFECRKGFYFYSDRGEYIQFVDGADNSVESVLDEVVYRQALRILEGRAFAQSSGNYEIVDRKWAISLVNAY